MISKVSEVPRRRGSERFLKIEQSPKGPEVPRRRGSERFLKIERSPGDPEVPRRRGSERFLKIERSPEVPEVPRRRGSAAVPRLHTLQWGLEGSQRSRARRFQQGLVRHLPEPNNTGSTRFYRRFQKGAGGLGLPRGTLEVCTKNLYPRVYVPCVSPCVSRGVPPY